jgi:hypothetical protein
MRSLALAACGLVVAAGLALLAVDVRSWDHRLAAGDARFQLVPGPENLWQPRELLPGGVARRLLGIGDDLAYRKAARLFRLSKPSQPAVGAPKLPAYRAQAEDELDHVLGQVHDPVRQARVTNLLGILALARASEEPTQTAALFRESILDFRKAVRFDPADHSAAANLELVLRLKAQHEQQEGSSSRSAGTAQKVGLGQTGSGY